MTRKDYIALAEAIGWARLETREVLGSSHVLSVAVRHIGDALAADNARFKRERFEEAAARYPEGSHATR